MATRAFVVSIHREWVVKVENDDLNEDDIYEEVIDNFLDTDFRDYGNVEEVDLYDYAFENGEAIASWYDTEIRKLND